jgi:hypothetical protein
MKPRAWSSLLAVVVETQMFAQVAHLLAGHFLPLSRVGPMLAISRGMVLPQFLEVTHGPRGNRTYGSEDEQCRIFEELVVRGASVAQGLLRPRHAPPCCGPGLGRVRCCTQCVAARVAERTAPDQRSASRHLRQKQRCCLAYARCLVGSSSLPLAALTCDWQLTLTRHLAEKGDRSYERSPPASSATQLHIHAANTVRGDRASSDPPGHSPVTAMYAWPGTRTHLSFLRAGCGVCGCSRIRSATAVPGMGTQPTRPHGVGKTSSPGGSATALPLAPPRLQRRLSQPVRPAPPPPAARSPAPNRPKPATVPEHPGSDDTEGLTLTLADAALPATSTAVPTITARTRQHSEGHSDEPGPSQQELEWDARRRSLDLSAQLAALDVALDELEQVRFNVKRGSRGKEVDTWACVDAKYRDVGDCRPIDVRYRRRPRRRCWRHRGLVWALTVPPCPRYIAWFLRTRSWTRRLVPPATATRPRLFMRGPHRPTPLLRWC